MATAQSVDTLPEGFEVEKLPEGFQVELTPEQFTKERQRASTKQIPDVNRRALGFGINALASGAQMIPGVGPFAAGAIGAAGTGLAQGLGLEPYDPKQIALQAIIPKGSEMAVKGLLNLPKVPQWITERAWPGFVREVGKITNPTAVRKAGSEAAMETLGAIPNAIDRANATPASKGAYAAAEASGPLPTAELAQTLDDVAANASRAIPARPAVKQIKATRENILPRVTPVEAGPATNMEQFLRNRAQAEAQTLQRLAAQPDTITYKQAIDEVHGLRAQAEMAFNKGNNVAGVELNNAATRMIEKMDNLSPAIKQANATYRKEESIKKIANALRQPRADKAFEVLIENDPLVRGSIPLNHQKTVESVAMEISKIGASGSPYSGVPAKFLNFLTRPIAEMVQNPVGMAYLRQSFKPAVKGAKTVISNPQSLWAAASFWRAYKAANAEEPSGDQPEIQNPAQR